MSEKTSELERLVEWLVPHYIKYCELTGKVPDYNRIPKYIVATRKDLPALLKPKKIQTCADGSNKV